LLCLFLFLSNIQHPYRAKKKFVPEKSKKQKLQKSKQLTIPFHLTQYYIYCISVGVHKIDMGIRLIFGTQKQIHWNLDAVLS